MQRKRPRNLKLKLKTPSHHFPGETEALGCGKRFYEQKLPASEAVDGISSELLGKRDGTGLDS